MTSKEKKPIQLKNILYLLIAPVAVWLIMEVVSRQTAGVSVIANAVDIRTLFRSLASTFCFAMALNLNVPMGRMDLSTGAQMYLACILGGNIALDLGLGGVGVVIFSMLVGCLAGFLVGVVFVNLRILSMVLGLGMTLIYECISFSMYKQQGLMLFGMPGVEILSSMKFIIVVAFVVILALTYILQLSNFGYKRRAIQGNQKLAVDSGINIYINCLICYAIAGALVALSGVFETAHKGSMVPVLGMSSNNNTFYNMFPMHVGMFLGTFVSNPIIGIFISSISLNVLIIGLAKLGLEQSVQTIIIFSIFLVFMIYRMNQDKFVYIQRKRVRKKEALQRRQEMGHLPA